MKTRACSLLVLTASLAAFAFTPAFATPPAKQAFSHPVVSVERFGNIVVVRGSAMMEVEQSLGVPHSKLGSEVWTYKNFNGGTAQRRDDDCSTLLIIFAQGRVSDLRLVNDRAAQIFAAQLRAKSQDKMQVAAK